jgi:hypothetical protein
MQKSDPLRSMFRLIKPSVAAVIIVTSFNFCKTKQTGVLLLEQFGTPPGVVRISSNLYVDRTQITNFSYSEFVWWTGHVYGRESPEYNFVYPDSSSWEKVCPKRIPFLKYSNHIFYRDFPVVGIDCEQAKKFSKWRSDRVMEYFLIREGILKNEPMRRTIPDSIFTIEKYFTGKYLNSPLNPNIQYYPDYQLPDTTIYTRLLFFADSLNSKNKGKKFTFYKSRNQSCKCIETKRKFICLEGLQSTRCSKSRSPLPLVLNGSVFELTNIKGLGYRCSLDQSADKVSETNFLRIDSAIFDVGFRNVCTWRKWQHR